jgi:hypothetical protein
MISAILTKTVAPDKQSCSPGKEESDTPAAIFEYVLPDVKTAADQKEYGKRDRCAFDGDVDPIGGLHGWILRKPDMLGILGVAGGGTEGRFGILRDQFAEVDLS